MCILPTRGLYLSFHQTLPLILQNLIDTQAAQNLYQQFPQAHQKMHFLPARPYELSYKTLNKYHLCPLSHQDAFTQQDHYTVTQYLSTFLGS